MVLMARPTSRVSDRLVGITESGEEVKFGPNLLMDTKIQLDLPDGTSLSFTALPAEAEKKTLKKLTQLKGKFNQFDPKKMLANAQRGRVGLDELVYFTNHDAKHSIVGDPPFWRGIKKIAVGFYLSKGFEQKYVQEVIEQVIQGVPAPRKISIFHYGYTSPVQELGEQEISHVIRLVGDPSIGMLYCYVELFNAHNCLILLNRHYYGPVIDEQYRYDLLTGTELDKPVILPFDNRFLFERFFDVDWDSSAQHQVAYDRTRKILADLLRAKGLIV
jgi:hypothetical protein